MEKYGYTFEDEKELKKTQGNKELVKELTKKRKLKKDKKDATNARDK